MGLAETPERAEKRIREAAAVAANAASPPLRTEDGVLVNEEGFPVMDPRSATKQSIKDASPALTITLRNVLRAWHKQGYKDVLDKAVLVCGTDFQWQALRGQIMDVMNDQERKMSQLVSRIVDDFTEKE